MKVAIIGAGVSGLSCAYELEKNGITPDIFEKRSRIGNEAGYSSLWTRNMDRRCADVINYLKKEYKLDIYPFSELNESIIISANKKTIINENMGYTFLRGFKKDSIENQIGSKIKTPINFDSYIKIDDIRNDYDHIVVATSNPLIPKQLNVWTNTFVAQARIANVLGDFKIDSITVWFNENYSDKAFCYLIPNSPKEASLVLIVNNISGRELDYYWDKFMLEEDIKYHVLQKCDIEHYCGFVNPLHKDNIFFVGNAGGFTDNFIGIGAIDAIESGIMAARSIISGKCYHTLIQDTCNDIYKLNEFRKIMNTFDNTSFDNSVAMIGIPGIKQFIYKNPFFKLNNFAPIAKFYNEHWVE